MLTSFQSLLSWIGLLNCPECDTYFPQFKFQSLLSWIGLLNKLSILARPPAWMFQSLLSWIGLLNYPLFHSLYSVTKGFNPCCPGSASSTVCDQRLRHSHHHVSILVVLDRPPQLSTLSTWKASMSLFQSLLSWIGLLNLPFSSST